LCVAAKAPISCAAIREADRRDRRVARIKQIGFAQGANGRDKIVARFNNNEFDVATLFFSRFRSVIAQVPTAQQIIRRCLSRLAKDAGPSATYEYEPEEEEILADLLPRNLSTQVFRALLENAASEQGAHERDG